MFHSRVDNGEHISKGQTLGFITDPFGDFKIAVKAPLNGLIIGINNSPIVNQGDALVHLGW
jgi:predicted deacylase